MLSRLAAAFALILFLEGPPVHAEDKDYLQRGEGKLTAPYEIKYDRAVRHVLSRAWRKDVVLRMVDIPPFGPEWVGGVCRETGGYHAFGVVAPKNIWSQLGFGSDEPNSKKVDYRVIRPAVFERAISETIAVRVMALWRRVLTDQRNYGKDPAIHLDTDQFSFYLAFAPGEKLTARMTGWGSKVEQLLDVADALVVYADGTITDRKLLKVVAKAEKKLGI